MTGTKINICVLEWIIIQQSLHNPYLLMIVSNTNNKKQIHLGFGSNWIKNYFALHFVIQYYVLQIKTWKCHKNLSPGNLLHVKRKTTVDFFYLALFSKKVSWRFSQNWCQTKTMHFKLNVSLISIRLIFITFPNSW